MNLKEKEATAIKRLKAFEPETEPYYLCYSGGKDSDCIRILAQLAGVKHEIHHNLTTVDAPETVQYVKSIPDVIIDKAKYPDGSHKTMWNLILKKGIPPTRLIRYCCSELKEQGGKHRVKITGVRWSESINRAESSDLVKIIGKPKTVQKFADEIGAEYIVTKQGGLIMNDDNDSSRRMVEHCYRTTSTMINPVVDWTDSEVWEFLRHYGCKSNPLYQCKLKRIGCIGCPMASTRHRLLEFEQYPTYKQSYIHAFDRMITQHSFETYSWKTGEDVFDWWLGIDSNQISFFE